MIREQLDEVYADRQTVEAELRSVPPGGIGSAMEQIHQALGELDARLSAFTEMLSPVLLPDEPTDGMNLATEPDRRSEIHESADDALRRITHHISRIERLHLRLDL